MNMKKIFISLFTVAALLASGSAMAQDKVKKEAGKAKTEKAEKKESTSCCSEVKSDAKATPAKKEGASCCSEVKSDAKACPGKKEGASCCSEKKADNKATSEKSCGKK